MHIHTFVPERNHWSLLPVFALGVWVVLAALPSVCRAQDLATVWQQAAATSPALAQARAQVEAQQAGRSIAKSAFLPHLQGDTSGGMNTAHITGFGSQEVSTGYHSDNFSASLTESIFDGQARMAMKESDSRVRASQAALAYAEQSLALAVTEAYFGVLRAQANEQVARQQKTLLENLYAETQASLHVGTGDIITVREVEAQLDAAKSDLIVATNAVAIAKDRLEELTHHPVGTLQDVTTLEPKGPQPDADGPWIEAALRNQPLLQQARAELTESEQHVEYAKRAWWPTLSLNGFGQHTVGMLFPSMGVDALGASLSLSVPIYQGGRIGAGVRQAKALSKASGARVDAMQDQIRLETRTAFLELQNSVEQFHAAKQAVRSAQTSLDATRKGFEIGSRSIIDLLTSTTQLAVAQRTYYLALYTQLVARVQLKAAAGVLSADDIQAINTLLTAAPPQIRAH